MNVVALNNPSPTLGNIFDFFVTTSLNKLSRYEDYEKEAESFLNLNPMIRSDDLGSIVSPYMVEQYNFSSGISESDKIDIIVTLDNFLATLKNILAGYKPTNNDQNDVGVKRQISPPYEAYHYVGNNELDITPTNASYGLLFERD